MSFEIFLRRKNKLLVNPGTGTLPDVYVATLLKNIEPLGYTFSKDLLERVKTFSVDEVGTFHHKLVDALRKIIGAHVRYEPMYPNFPMQVMKASESELYFNALMHYLGDWIGIRILPVYQKEKREDLRDTIKLKVIDLGTAAEFESIFTRLVMAKASISETDKKDLQWFIVNLRDDIVRLLPEVIPQKENLAFVGALLLAGTNSGITLVTKYCKTATDVLRIAVGMSSGDVSLAENTKFKAFRRRERKLLLILLEPFSHSFDEFIKYKEVWIRLGERLHPFEYKKKFPKCFVAFDLIRNDRPYQTFYSKVEGAILSNDSQLATQLLSERPGELARRIDQLLRLSDEPKTVLHSFNAVASKVSTAVLLQLLTHFQHRNEPRDLRVFFPKGNASKAMAIPYNLPPIDNAISDEVIKICRQQLIQRFSKLPRLGNVFLGDDLKNFTVPFSLRSASKALKTISRGSRLPLPEGNTLRFFIWWKDGKDRTDIDLSAVGLDEDHNFKTVLAYYDLRNLGGHHSGDITSAPEGASEFIDIDIEKFITFGIRYVQMSVNSFTNQPFCDLPECFAGLMVRQYPDSGEVYDPRTVENKIDITANTKVCIPMIIDLDERQIIWTDLALTNSPSVNNVHGNLPAITILNKAMTSLVKTSLYDLFELHVTARGHRVLDREHAKTIFATDNGITPFETEKIIAEFL